jgi:hypothetical protein
MQGAAAHSALHAQRLEAGYQMHAIVFTNTVFADPHIGRLPQESAMTAVSNALVEVPPLQLPCHARLLCCILHFIRQTYML